MVQQVVVQQADSETWQRTKRFPSSKIKNITIGTANQAKFQMYKDLLDFLEERGVVVSLLSKDQLCTVNVIETLDDMRLNAVKKAKAYAKITNTITLSDDTGFFIPALNNEPGIAVRRWAGQLPENISDKGWEDYFVKKIQDCRIKEPSCFKLQIIALCDPSGHCQLIEHKTNGVIKMPGFGTYTAGGPLSSYFFINECQKFETDLNKQDKKILFGELKLKILNMLLTFGKI